jgi:hypothetical protein
MRNLIAGIYGGSFVSRRTRGRSLAALVAALFAVAGHVPAASALPGLCAAQLCEAGGPHVVVGYRTGPAPGSVPANDLRGARAAGPANGVPDFVDDVVDSLEDAWAEIAAQGYALPSVPVRVELGAVPFPVVNAPMAADPALPGATSPAVPHVVLPASEASRTVTARRALFAFVAEAYLDGGGLHGANLAGVSWWLDATSAWVAAASTGRSPWLTAAQRRAFLGETALFLSTPAEDVTTWDGPTASPSRSRGALLLPAFVAEEHGAAAVRAVLDGIAAAGVTPYTQNGVAGLRAAADPVEVLGSVLTAHGDALPSLLQRFAEADWRLGCAPVRGPDADHCAAWQPDLRAALQADPRTAGAFGDAPRPAHATAGLPPPPTFGQPQHVTGDVDLAPGGTAYVRLDVPPLPEETGPACDASCFVGAGVVAGAVPASAVPFTVSFLSYGANYGAAADSECAPAGRAASATGGPVLFGTRIVSGCAGGVLVVTRTDAGPRGALGADGRGPVRFTWQAYAQGAVIFDT